MLFNSQVFLLLFLPVALGLWYACAAHRRLRTWVLIATSLVFYGYWDVRLVPLLVASICVNWLLARAASRWAPRPALITGVTVNIVVLGVFKYADFFASALVVALGQEHRSFGIVLPLGISFFTFQQISYLVDIGRGKAPQYRFEDYALYVSFFPQLIAGPIVRHNQIIPQYSACPTRAGMHERFGRGLVLLLIGLVKKVVLADELARIADPVFDQALAGAPLGLTEAWCATLAFGFQIYFDFSGYSDMAIGLGLMFGLVLPENFNAPYVARSISEFWRRWHMTLSSFLRDYLYIALGGSRHGLARQWLALMVTMLLGGLWHGAAWTFVAWGALHGLALSVNHAARRFGIELPGVIAWPLTFAFVMQAWVLFRAESFIAARYMLETMWTGSLDGTLAPDRAWLLAPAALVALFGPTSLAVAQESLRPHRSLALASGVALMVLVVMVGGWRTAEFIYFQF
jgi:D-alanyl-lipoteichoic acid acyltransferase DltB (MBOAT superfamily)